MTAKNIDGFAERAGIAFLALAQQINHLLDLISFYTERYPVIDESSALKHKELSACIQTLGKAPQQLSLEIRSWCQTKKRMLSAEGIQLELLNEIACTIDVLTLFFIANGIEVHPFNHSKSVIALEQLSSINRCLK